MARKPRRKCKPKRKIVKRAKIQLIRWVDTTSYSAEGWCDHEAAAKAKAHCPFSTGFLISEDKDVVRLAISYGAKNNDWTDIQVIPKGCIEKRETICTVIMREDPSR